MPSLPYLRPELHRTTRPSIPRILPHAPDSPPIYASLPDTHLPVDTHLRADVHLHIFPPAPNSRCRRRRPHRTVRHEQGLNCAVGEQLRRNLRLHGRHSPAPVRSRSAPWLRPRVARAGDTDQCPSARAQRLRHVAAPFSRLVADRRSDSRDTRGFRK